MLRALLPALAIYVALRPVFGVAHELSVAGVALVLHAAVATDWWPRLKAAFEATGVDRPWLVYGANVYAAARLQQVVDAWPKQWLDAPLVLSEFAPGGVGPAERPLGFQQDWSIIRSRPGVVLGGLAYTWATNGPEDLDRVFGLIDPQGVPSDGALAALSISYLSDRQQTASSPPPG